MSHNIKKSHKQKTFLPEDKQKEFDLMLNELKEIKMIKTRMAVERKRLWAIENKTDFVKIKLDYMDTTLKNISLFIDEVEKLVKIVLNNKL